MSKQLKDYILGFVFFIAHLIILTLGYSYIRNITVSEDKNRYKYIAINEANYISNVIDKVIVRTYTLREMINENNGEIDFFDKVAPVIIQSIKEDTGIVVTNLLLAPDGIVKKVEPEKNNKELLGFNFTDITKAGNKEALEANIKSRTILTPPFSLVQGGVGMAARTPVYLNHNEKTRYWGLVSTTMDFNDVLKALNFDTFSKMNINYCLWYINEKNEKIILSSNTDEIKDPITENVILNNLTWHLDVCPSKGWKNENLEKLIHLVIFIVSAFMTAFVLLMFRIRRDGNKMKTLAEQDHLTNCYSRYYLNNVMLNPENGEWRTPSNNYSVAIVDVDKFKQINDKYGHPAGDRALVAIADILKNSISKPAKDRIVRFGGDEFIIFFSDIERKTLRIKFQDILSAVEQIRFEDYPELKLSISMGVSIPENLEDKSYKNMVKIADDNLYKVKEAGRNNYLM
ncbi:MAG: sensor domain-containing diguanylate cyclase [Treponema sp.]|nr:sensor domain-containing diguanylate cyclase [Treponema sp.]